MTFLEVETKGEYDPRIKRIQIVDDLNITFDGVKAKFDQIEFLSKYLTTLLNAFLGAFKGQIIKQMGAEFKLVINEILREKYKS